MLHCLVLPLHYAYTLYREVLRGCLHIDPAERLTADELLGMEWFKVLDVTELDHAVEVRGTEHTHLQMIVLLNIRGSTTTYIFVRYSGITL
jgi:serine/threonine protein kinase